jgi:hypothetical protein
LGSDDQREATMKLRQFAGLALLLGVIAVIAIYLLLDGDTPPDGPEPVTVIVKGGGKGPFLENPQLVQLLKDKYGLTIDFTRVPSIDMYDQCAEGIDACWPSSQTIGELLESKPGITVLQSETIFNSPIVLYSWVPIVDALVAQGIVEQSGDTYYVVDLAQLLDMVANRVLWSAIGLPNINGPVNIRTSDPVASNSGNSFVGLMANTLNGGVVVDEAAVDQILPQLSEWYNELMWEQFFTLGMGASPIIAAYESNLIEYCLQNSSDSSQQFIRANVRTLYPRPTVWSSHPMLALTDAGQRLIEALRDPEVQRLGWEQHGFRSAVPGVANDPDVCSLSGVPASIDSVSQMPNPAAMIRIIEGLGGRLVTMPTPAALTREMERFGGKPVAAVRRREDEL